MMISSPITLIFKATQLERKKNKNKIYSGGWMAPYRGRNSYSQSTSKS